MSRTRKKPARRATGKPRATGRRRSAAKLRAPARTTTRATKTRSHHHPELWGLGMVAVGAFLATLLWFGWDGGPVGEATADGLHSAFGSASYVIPLVLLGLGALMLVRSKLVDLKPFRTGLAIGAFGLMLALGRDQGGMIGSGLAGGLANFVGETGVLIVGGALLLAGTLLFTGGSAGAVLRTSGGAMRRAGGAARRSFDGFEMPDFGGADERDDDYEVEERRPVVDAATAYPDVIEPVATSAESPQLVMHSADNAPDALTADDAYEEIEFDSAAGVEYRLPDRSLLKPSPAVKGDNGVQSAKTAEQLVQTLSHFGVDATIVGQIAGPRVVRYELQLAPGTKVSKVAGLKDDLSYALATTEIRILAPIPGKQAVGVEVPNLSPKLVTLGDIFGDMPGQASPLSVWL
ncbi:DNA translocase FtsK, partial [Gaiella sp.]